jgi:hypothetical protein
MLSIARETERTLFFVFLPLDHGKAHGFTTRFHLYTVPGQILFEQTRVAVLNGADGVVVVEDAERERLAGGGSRPSPQYDQRPSIRSSRGSGQRGVRDPGSRLEARCE